MSMLPRRGVRRSLLTIAVAVASLCAAVATAVPAAAVGNGFDPAPGPMIPGTSTVVNEWKLAGQGFAQGVQIAPQWIVASGHAPALVGGRFTNEYGSAPVDNVVVCGVAHSGCDISVAHLSTPIAAPGFPPLLQDGVPVEAGRTPAGHTLAVGNGGSTLGRPTAGWTLPVPGAIPLSSFQNQIAAVNGDRPPPSTGSPTTNLAHGGTCRSR